MSAVIECVPNVSEGRDEATLDYIAGAVCARDGVALLDVDRDADHHRAVITFAGAPEPVAEAAYELARRAVERIDLTAHRGEHPRMGALDVLPFVPLKGASIDDCVSLAQRVGERIATELSVPVYLYEAAATRPERANLAVIRKGQFEGFAEKIQQPDWAPDCGERRVHPTAGVTAVGARPPLIAFNVDLGTDELEVAKRIAQAVRHSSGGLRHVKALGFALEARGIVQVSMNMTDFSATPLCRALELIRREAAGHGVSILNSEIVGLVPQAALLDAAAYYLQLAGFQRDQVLEERLAQAFSDAP